MAAAQYDKFRIHQGETFKARLIYEAPSGLPIDLTGCTARMHVREKYNSPLPLFELSTENGGIVLGDETGTIDLLLPDEQTLTTPIPDTGARPPTVQLPFDLAIIFPVTGQVDVILYGNITAIRGVTR
jgi:hypothetical protein